MARRTITLTDRPPVTIDEDAWPVIASATDDEHDGEVRCQANRESEWSIRVRQHADGRTIVYATYSYSSHWQSERGYQVRQGVLLPSAYVRGCGGCGTNPCSCPGGPGSRPSMNDIVAAIKTVGADMASCDANGADAERWDGLIDECIADLPAEELT